MVSDIHISGADRASPSGLYHTGDVLTATVSFSEALATVPAGTNLKLTLKIAGNDRNADYTSQSLDKKTLFFTYRIVDTDRSGDITIPANALKPLGDANLTDVAGNRVTASENGSVISAAVAATPSFKVDNEIPRIIEITSTQGNGTYNVDEVIDIRATPSKALQAGAQVTITLNNGDPVTLTRDVADDTLLKGSYKVLAGPSHAAADLNVASIAIGAGASAVDLAGNSLASTLPAAGHNLADLKDIVLNTLIPATPTRFELAPGSDTGSSSNDGLTSVNRPTFLFSGLKQGANVEVSAILNGAKKSFNFIATGASTETYTLATPQPDGIYRDITVRQISGGNASLTLALGGTAQLGTLTIDTVAPAAAPGVAIFDDRQDRQTQSEMALGTGTSLARDFRTFVTTPRFDFTGGKDGETALLFRDQNGNGSYDGGELVLGRAIIGSANAITFPNPALTGLPANINGHYVDVQLPLSNGQYTDIYLALQSPSGATGPAVKATSDPSGRFQIQINSNAPATPLTSVSTEQVAGNSSGTKMSFTAVGGQVGATIEIRATGPEGSVVTLGNATLDGTGQFTLNVANLEGAYREFMAIQTWNGVVGAAKDVVAVSSGNPLGAVTWDHSVPTVTVSPAIPENNFVSEGKTVSVKFVFSRPVAAFDATDVDISGGTLGALTWNSDHTEATATFTANQSLPERTVSLQVKPGSYTNLAGAPGAGSTALTLAVNHAGSVDIQGSTGSGAAPKVGDNLSLVLRDADALDPATTLTYVWSRSTAGAPAVVIGGQSGRSYVVTPTDVGSVIRGEVTYRDMFEAIRFEPVTVGKTTAVVLGANDPGAVSIIGNGAYQGILNPGNTLTATATDGNGLTMGQVISYQWNRDGVAIAGATSKTYTVLDSDITHTITATASYVDDHGNADHPVSAGMQVKASNQLGTVTIVHADADISVPEFREGQVIKAMIADGDGVPATGITYQWFRGDALIASANGQTYTIMATDKGQSLSVKAVYTDLHGYAESRGASAISVSANGNRRAEGEITFNGAGKIGSFLAAVSTVTDEDGIPTTGPDVPTYKWYTRDSSNTLTPINEDHLVKGQPNKSQLQITSDLLGADIVAELQFKDNGGSPEAVRSTSLMLGSWEASYKLDPVHESLGFTTADATQARSPSAQLLRLAGTTKAGDSDLFILDVNGDGQITQADATTYIGRMDGGKTLYVSTNVGRGAAVLLGRDDPAWEVLRNDPGKNGISPLASNGTATGKAGSVVGTTTTLAGDFWTSTPGTTANSHMVFTTDASGPYSKADNSYTADLGRLHYNIFHLSVIPT
nr:Ig-like domain-containing protein [Herbaspirillum sp. ASV7]